MLMLDLPTEIVAFLLFFHCLIGGVAALVAQNKGYSKFWSLVFGLIGGTPALVVALYIKRKV